MVKKEGVYRQKITPKMYEAAYVNAKKVYLGEVQKKYAVEKLVLTENMKESSADFYVNSVLDMFNGKVFKRSINISATEFYLKQIAVDFGVVVLANALKSLDDHIEYFNEQGKGRLIGLRKLYEKYKSELNHESTIIYADEVLNDNNLFEGAGKSVLVNRYERNSKARRICIEYYKAICAVCNINFREEYGEIGVDFIHVHHTKPLSEIGDNYQINPLEDLIPVCPNCHSMIHQRKPPYSVQELKQKIDDKGGMLSKRLKS